MALVVVVVVVVVTAVVRLQVSLPARTSPGGALRM
jgi:hypothetical protein